MTIRRIRVTQVAAPLVRPFWMSLEPYTSASELIVQIETDQGLTGIGQIHGRPLDRIAAIVADACAPLLMGQDPMEHERHWSRLFSLTHTRDGAGLHHADGQPHFGAGARAQIMAAIAGIDIALWDLKGKICGQPVFKLLGASRSTVACYASGGYYGPHGEANTEELVAEMQAYVGQGFRAVKMKVGGLAIAEDTMRVAHVREAIGPDIGLMLDANLAYDVPAAIAAARAFAPYGITWFEEPVQWYDAVFGLGQVAAATDIPIASGESELHRWGCRDLILHGGIRVLQFDATRAGGVTEWLRVAASAASHGIVMAPHHDPQIHAHLIAAVPNGHVQEVFPNPQRDPLWASLYRDRPEIVGGTLHLSHRPGFGFSLDLDALEQCTVASRVI